MLADNADSRADAGYGYGHTDVEGRELLGEVSRVTENWTGHAPELRKLRAPHTGPYLWRHGLQWMDGIRLKRAQLWWIFQLFMLCSARQMLGLSLSLLLTVVSGRAQDSRPSEYQLKAAFLFNFAKFVEWPSDAFVEATSPFIIGTLGGNPFGGDLERTIRDKKINNRVIIFKEFRTLTEATNCHILFINASERPRLPEIVAGLRRTSVLTVSEMEGFTGSGGMINFVQEHNKIRFQINDEAAKAANLRISSKLLSIALPTVH